MKRFEIHRSGRGHLYANLLGSTIAYGYFKKPDTDESQLQLVFGIGLWWFTIRIILWREK